MTRATSLEELEPLLGLCRAGKLFDVIEWVKSGKPVAVPDGAGVKGAHRNPLRIAMDRGFHSLVQVLLDAGAPHRLGTYDALAHSVDLRRPDLGALLIQHGARVADVSMRTVIEMWEPEMVDLFLANGANLVEARPVAWGLINKVRPALGLLRRFGDAIPDLRQQANCALCHHAYEGNVKWVSLMLWAGADPWAKGPTSPDDDDSECFFNAIEWAAMAGKVEVLQLKKLTVAYDATREGAARVLEHAHDSQVLELLLAQGHRPDHLVDGGTGAINSLLHSISWGYVSIDAFLAGGDRVQKKVDTSRGRDRLKMLHMLLANGAKWLPEDKRAISYVRRELLKMTPAYWLEIAWLMHRYRGARRRDVEELFRTSAVTQLLGEGLQKATQLIAGIPEDPVAAPSAQAPVTGARTATSTDSPDDGTASTGV